MNRDDLAKAAAVVEEVEFEVGGEKRSVLMRAPTVAEMDAVLQAQRDAGGKLNLEHETSVVRACLEDEDLRENATPDEIMALIRISGGLKGSPVYEAARRLSTGWLGGEDEKPNLGPFESPEPSDSP